MAGIFRSAVSCSGFRPLTGLLALGLATISVVGWSQPETGSLVTQAWEVVRRRALHPPVDEHDLVASLISALKDPYARFVTANEVRILHAAGAHPDERTAGIGAQIHGVPFPGQAQPALTIAGVLPGRPAARGGMRPGDVIVSVDGQSIRRLPLDQAVAKIRGKPGTRVTLEVLRPGVDGALRLTLVREPLNPTTTVTARLLSPDVGYLSLTQLNGAALTQLRAALPPLLAGGARQLVLDLRQCPGAQPCGLRTGTQRAMLPRFSGIELLSDWQTVDEFCASLLGPGTFGQLRLRGKPNRLISSDAPAPRATVAAVLTSRLTAGAAEFLTLAARKQTGAKVIGARTAGKTTVQDLFSLADDSAIILSVGRWTDAEGKTVDGRGIEPDVVLPGLRVPGAEGNDPAVAKALQVIRRH